MQGAPTDVVRDALDRGTPLSGTGGFAGELEPGTLVRDVLGRYPLFSAPGDPTTYTADPTDLVEPQRVPAGHRRDADGDTRVWTLPDPDPSDDSGAAVAAVRAAVERSVAGVVGDPPVAFSGGVDSGLVARGSEGPLFVGGFPDSDDVTAARSAADALDRDLEVVEFTHAALEAAVPEVVAATGRSNAMDVGIALPLFSVAEAAAADMDSTAIIWKGTSDESNVAGQVRILESFVNQGVDAIVVAATDSKGLEIGRASCRERV